MSRLSRLLSSSIAVAGARAVRARAGAGRLSGAHHHRGLRLGRGGAVDVTTRIITDHMAKTLGQNIVVQNEPGAGGTLSIEPGQQGPAGRLHAADHRAVGRHHQGAVPERDRRRRSATFSRSRSSARRRWCWWCTRTCPATDYKSLLAYIKAHPGELTFASNGRGSAGHLAGSLFKKMADADIRYIPYRTTPQATADLIGGRISMIWLSSLGNLAGTGAVRPIAVIAGRRALEAVSRRADLRRARPQGLRGHHLGQHVRAEGRAAGGGREAHRRGQRGAGRSRGAEALRQGRHRQAARRPGRRSCKST